MVLIAARNTIMPLLFYRFTRHPPDERLDVIIEALAVIAFNRPLAAPLPNGPRASTTFHRLMVDRLPDGEANLSHNSLPRP